MVVPLVSIGADQASNVYYSSNSDANIYAEYLDSIREPDDVESMVKYLNGLTHAFLKKTAVILYISPSTITHPVWASVIKSLITKRMVHFFCVDECHYITNAGRYFRPEFFINIRFIQWSIRNRTF